MEGMGAMGRQTAGHVGRGDVDPDGATSLGGLPVGHCGSGWVVLLFWAGSLKWKRESPNCRCKSLT